MSAHAAAAFVLPPALEAHEPPEVRGHGRGDVALMVASRGRQRLEHRRFGHLPEILRSGDLLVVNTSATLPAAVPAVRPDGARVQVRFATAAPHLDEGRWRVVELRSADGVRPLRDAKAGERFDLPGEAWIAVVAPYARSARLWLARLHLAGQDVVGYLAGRGAPIRYGYVPRAWPLAAYQTVFAREPGSAEMPSAARPFTTGLVARLRGAGIGLAPVTLHCGVSSPERHEPPFPEAYRVPAATARAIAATRRRGGRVIAVGTTVVRALETVTDGDGRVHAGTGWTGHVVTPELGVRAVDGLITGWHEPQASHLLLLEALAGAPLLEASYRAALDRGYRWHEFGDSHLILP